MKNYIKWFIVCLCVFLISFFLHECGHGLANCLSGISCSTGFNKVGDIYKYPNDLDFRETYNQSKKILLDFAVPCTLILAIIGTLMFYKCRSDKVKYFGGALAATNSMIRLVPCLWVVLLPLINGKVHVEDEYETGTLLVEMTEFGFLLYIPVLLSIAISAICIILIIKKAYSRRVTHVWIYVVTAVISFGVNIIIINILDNLIRINWSAI